MDVINLGIVEDDSMVRSALTEYFTRQSETKVVLTGGSVEEFLSQLPGADRLDIILLDIGLPGMSGLEGIEAIKYRRPEAEIIMLTAFDDYDRIYTALCKGAISYLSKRAELSTIKEALLIVHRGGSYMSPEIARKIIDHLPARRGSYPNDLTERQNEIVQGLVDGLSYKLIADKYHISVETVRDHIKKIYKKLQVNSKAEVIRKRMDGEI